MRSRTQHTRRARGAVIALALLLLPAAASPAGAQDTQGRLDSKRADLDAAQQRQGVQTSTLDRLSGEVDDLTAELAAARGREAEAQAELAAKEKELTGARDDLIIARERLRRAVKELRSQLVAIYKSPTPDILAVILDSDSYDDLLGRSNYMSSIQGDGEDAAKRVRDLRDQTASTVRVISQARDRIATEEAGLERIRVEVEAQEAALVAARERQQQALARTRTEVGALQGKVSNLERKIQAELRAAQAAAQAEVAAPAPLPAGPSPTPTSSGLIWPVEGTVTSPFGPRWGTIHAGLDIGGAEGTPIKAADGGTVVMASYNGGYGNYTCIDHGGGFSTCYAHQSAIGVSVGQDVRQGEVIGAVGNTGNSFGAHLHFETRVNGVPQDPLGYL